MNSTSQSSSGDDLSMLSLSNLSTLDRTTSSSDDSTLDSTSSSETLSSDADAHENKNIEGSRENERDEGEEYLDENNEEPYSEPLYAGAKMTVIESYMMVMRYSLCHSLTKQALSELLYLLDVHLPESSMVSLYKLRKFFLQLYEDITFQKHHCCSICHSPLATADSSCRHGCNGTYIEFLSIHIEPQLRRRFQGM